jgi:hypothetical protein
MRLWLVRVLPATLLAGMLAVVPAAGTVAPAHALQLKDLNKIQRRNLSGFAFTELTQQPGVGGRQRPSSSAPPGPSRPATTSPAATAAVPATSATTSR